MLTHAGSNKGVVTVHEGSAPFKRKFEPKAHFTGEIKDIDVLSTAHGVYVCATDETGQCKVWRKYSTSMQPYCTLA